MMRWLRPACIRPDLLAKPEGDFYRVSAVPPSVVPKLPPAESQDGHANGHVVPSKPPEVAPKPHLRHEVAYVELLRNAGESLGIIIAGGVDRNQPVMITNIRPDSVAKRSESLEVGDRILAVNGAGTAGLSHNEVVQLLQTSGSVVSLEIEYSLGQEVPSVDSNVCKRRVEVRIHQKNGSYGFRLRGGAGDPRRRPLTFAHIVPQSDGYCQGLVKIGDRLLKINGADMNNKSVDEAMAKLNQSGNLAVLEVEYDVTIQDGLDGGGPVLVDLSKPAGVSLGLTLSGSHTPGDPIVISHIRSGGLADRCGALHAGNQLLSINGSSLESRSLPEAVRMLLKSVNTVRLEVISGDIGDANDDGLFDPDLPSPPAEMLTENSLTPSSPPSTVGLASSDHFLPGSSAALYSHRGDIMAMANDDSAVTPGSSSLSVSSVAAASNRQAPFPPARHTSALSSPDRQLSIASGVSQRRMTSMQMCRQETVEVELQADPFGYGLSLQGGATRYESGPVTISFIEKDSPADRVGVLHIHDRVISINGTNVNGLTLEQVCKVIRESAGSMLLLMEFDVAEGVIPGSGTFDVKLFKSGSSLGITINSGSAVNSTRGLWISQVKKGGVAYRSGMVEAGDQLKAINGRSVEHCSLTHAGELLKACGNIVTLQICKDCHVVGDPNSVVFTVELVRHGANLGITINGSNIPGEPVYVASIKEDGVAYKTGALQVGDCILAINGHSLRDCTLDDTVELLQKAGDKVTMQLSRIGKRPPHTNSDGVSVASGNSSSIVASGNLRSLLSPIRHQNGQGVDADEGLSDRGSPFSQRTASDTSTPTHPVSVQQQTALFEEVQRRYTNRRTASTLESSECNGVEWRSAGQRHASAGSGTPSRSEHPSSYSQHVRHASALKYISTGPQETNDSRGRNRRQLGSDTGNSLKTMAYNGGEAVQHSPSGSALRELESDLMESSTFTLMFGERSASAASGTQSSRPATQTPDSSSFLQAAFLRSRSQGTPSVADQQSLDSGASKGSASQAGMSSVEFHVVELVRQHMASFGFSISDGQSQPGVYIRAIQPGGVADQSGLLKPLDRIMQVNEADVRDFDCRRTVPLLAKAGVSLRLVVCRCTSPYRLPELSSPH